jgi:hypothetical protein
MTADALSEVSNGAKWNPDPSFNVADAILANPEFASVLKVVLRDGHVLVPAPTGAGKTLGPHTARLSSAAARQRSR